jgi:hypothetical protein
MTTPGVPWHVKAGAMTQTSVELEALKYGFHLEQIEVDQTLVWQWRRPGTLHDSPMFLDEAQASSWMDHAIRTATLFDD